MQIKSWFSNQKLLTIGIDASNLRRGGGLTHLVEILAAADPILMRFEKVYLWGGEETLNQIVNRKWLIKKRVPVLERSVFHRIVWRRFVLPKVVFRNGCDVLFVPGGGSCAGRVPVVTMSRNMLPFEYNEMMRYGVSLVTIRLFLLRFYSKISFKNATGIIFLTRYAHSRVMRVVGGSNAKTYVIPHGINKRFFKNPSSRVNNFSKGAKCKIIYVSIIDQYKHQWNVVAAVKKLRSKGFDLELQLVGPSYKPALKRLIKAVNLHDSGWHWVKYLRDISYSELHRHYHSADVGLFASSCENLPNILLEMMASGLPIACSDRGPMCEILGDGGEYFNPEDVDDIASALEKLLLSEPKRKLYSERAYTRSLSYSWDRTALATFSALVECSI